MGMFDCVYFLDGAPKCGEGHEQLNVELQTKDLDCNLDHYTISKGELRLHWAHPVCKTPEGDVGKRIVVPTLNVYTACTICDPVWGDTKKMLFGPKSYLQPLNPWNEWILIFKEGVLERIEVLALGTRAGERKIHKGNWILLDDDDPRAIAETKSWRERHARYGGLGRGTLQERPDPKDAS